INVTGGPDLTLWEVNEASTLITEAAHEEAEVIFGAVINPELKDDIVLTVIATGFQLNAQAQISDHIHRMQAMASAQIQMQQDPFAQGDMYKQFSHMPAPAAPVRESAPVEKQMPMGEPLSPLGEEEADAAAAQQAS